MCCYHYSYLSLLLAHVGCHMEVCASLLYHVYQGRYEDMYDIYLDGAEHTICRGCVDNIWMGGKPDKLKKVQHSTVYRTDELEEGK